MIIKDKDKIEKSKKLYDAMSKIDDDLIEEARPQTFKQQRPNLKKWLAAAAAILIIILGAPNIMKLWSQMPDPDPQNLKDDKAQAEAELFAPEKEIGNSVNYGPLLTINYPQTHAFEDLDSAKDVREQNPLSEDFLSSITTFSYQTAAAILSDNSSGENLNYSPLSLYFALAIASSGSKSGSETALELSELLAVEDTVDLDEQSGNLYRRLYSENEIGKLRIANSLWLNNNLKGEPVHFKDDFIKNTAENYYASSHSIDFSDHEAAGAMAAWIAENTAGTSEPELKLNPNQIFSLINTIYFHDQWTNRFDIEKTGPDKFYLSDGKVIETDFMQQIFSSAGFSHGNGFTRAKLDLKNGSSMVFVLPDETVSPYELIATPEKLEETFSGGESLWGEVHWKVPKFSFGTKLDLAETLQKLGLEKAFTSEADFSNITEHKAFISSVSQESHIEINEEGVEASTFTQIDFVGAAPPEDHAEMLLNRPFLFAITKELQYENGNDTEISDTYIFIGICENPNN